MNRKKPDLLKFLDDFALAARGFLLAFGKARFRSVFILTFLFFGLLINLLSNGFSSFRLLFSGNFALSWKILSAAFLGIFGIGKNLPDFLLNFALTLLQASLVSLVVFVYRHNRASAESSSGLESSALVAGLAILGSGCPTCGTTLLAPLLSTLFSGLAGGVALAGKLALLFNCLAFLFGLLAFRKLGLETYAIIKSEQFMNRKRKETPAHESRS
ncbi:hypothetical protein IJI72_00350 [Candidatus Saccharibacteria bacterium]|nr:hypothetical protein [Candidatus Saccharibacteria bacterium]